MGSPDKFQICRVLFKEFPDNIQILYTYFQIFSYILYVHIEVFRHVSDMCHLAVRHSVFEMIFKHVYMFQRFFRQLSVWAHPPYGSNLVLLLGIVSSGSVNCSPCCCLFSTFHVIPWFDMIIFGPIFSCMGLFSAS